MIAAPFAAFILLSLTLLSLRPQWGLRETLLRAAIAWSAYSVLIVEALSPFDGLTSRALVVSWILPCIGMLVYLLKNHSLHRMRPISLTGTPRDPLYLAILTAIGIILLCTFLAALLYPPQAYESLRWQMARVARWAEHQSLEPFATGVENQNTMAPGAQIPVLHLYILAGSDYLSNLVQWFSMAGSLLAVSLVTKRLGGNRLAQASSSLVAATLPMGIAMSSSAEMEYVAAFFLLCAIVEILPFFKDSPSLDAIVFSGLSVGLAVLAKVTVIVFALPFAVGLALALAQRREFGQGLRALALASLLIVLVNLGHGLRTYQVFGGFFEPGQVATHANRQRDLRGLASNLLRNMAVQVGTPSEAVNDWLFEQIIKVHVKIGQRLNDPRTTAHTSFHIRRPALKAGTPNPIHAALTLVTFMSLVCFRRLRQRSLIMYAILVSLSFVLYSYFFRWQIFGIRYFLAFFVLAAPIIGIVLASLHRLWLGIVCLALFGLSQGYLVRLDSRPLFENGGVADVARIGKASRADLYFASMGGLRKPQKGSCCKDLALGLPRCRADDLRSMAGS